MTALAPILQAYFTDRLIGQLQASPNTIAGYRDTFRLLLGYTATRTAKPPSQLDLADLDAPSVAGFLDHLEHDRGNSVRTRNTRLAAIHSLFGYAALRHPEHAASIQRMLAVPPKRFQRNLITYLTNEEADALLAACDPDTWAGRRDHAMLALTLQTGLRISELTALSVADLQLGRARTYTASARAANSETHHYCPTPWKCCGAGSPNVAAPRRPIVPHQHRQIAQPRCGRAPNHALHQPRPRIVSVAARSKRVTAHTLRHSAAMALLLAGVDITVIALWLGHEQTATAELYLHADMTLKERAIAATAPTHTKPGRYQPPDPILAFLEGL
ncbi:phage integrase family protein [Mycobacterium kansasii 732]|nr:phage integrase family protein [Mycobacterium kansasii 732]